MAPVDRATQLTLQLSPGRRAYGLGDPLNRRRGARGHVNNYPISGRKLFRSPEQLDDQGIPFHGGSTLIVPTDAYTTNENERILFSFEKKKHKS